MSSFIFLGLISHNIYSENFSVLHRHNIYIITIHNVISLILTFRYLKTNYSYSLLIILCLPYNFT